MRHRWRVITYKNEIAGPSKRIRTLTPDELESIDLPAKPVTVAQLGEWLSVSRRFIEGEIARGHLRVRKISPRCVRIMPSDIARWLEQAATVEVA